MGKTTLLKYLFLNCVKQVAGIPIYIELRKLSKDKSVLDFIHEQLADLSELEGAHRSHLVHKLLNSGEFVLFFDGYDEIPEDQRAAVTADLQYFLQKAQRNKYVMASRDEIGLTAFPQFQRFKIRPLQKDEAYTLLRKYADGNLAATLISKLEQPENTAIHEFLSNPLLTSLLYKSFEYKQIIPLKKHHFYRQVFDALYETHDLTKEGGEYQRIKKSGMDIDQFEQILRSLGFLSYRKDKIEFTKDELLGFIHKAKELSSDNKATPSNILHDLTHAVPLMVEEGNYIRWTHKSIQEYFAAQYIFRNTNGKQKELLLHFLHSEDFSRHMNLLILCADIDKTSFKHSIAKELAEVLLSMYDSIYDYEVAGISRDVMEDRRCLTAGRYFFVTRVNLPPNFSTATELNEFKGYDNYVTEIHGEIVKQSHAHGIDHKYGSTISWGNVGISEVFSSATHTIRYMHRITDLPFIEPISKSPRNDFEDFLNGIDKALHEVSRVQIIDDEPTNPLNQHQIFEDINRLLEIYAGWKFNPHNARKFLKEIDNESQAQEDFIGGLYN